MTGPVKPLRPVDGEFRSSAGDRRSACSAAGHPLLYLNASVSSQARMDLRRCLCGENDQAAAWLKQRNDGASRRLPAARPRTNTEG